MEQLSITSWPGGSIHVPEIYAPELLLPWGDVQVEVLDDGAAGVVAWPWFDASSEEVLPEELYLRELRQLDLDSHDDVAAFVTRFGALRLGGARRQGKDLPYLEGLLGGFLDETDRLFMGIDVEALRAVGAEAAAFAAGSRLIASRPDHVLYEPLAEFRLAAAWLRDLTTIAVALDAGELDEGPKSWESCWIDRPVSLDSSCELLSRGLEALLRPFAPRVRIVRESVIGEYNEWMIESGYRDAAWQPGASDKRAEQRFLGTSFEGVPLVSALALQLYNHVVERATYRWCANETCGRPFVTQQGRAKHGQHWKHGLVKYCERSCANAQTQRESRRRKAAARKAEEGQS